MEHLIKEFIVNYTARASQLRIEAKQFDDRQMKRDSLVSAHTYDIVIGELKEILSGETVKFCEICPSCGSDDITNNENVNLCYQCDHVWMADE